MKLKIKILSILMAAYFLCMSGFISLSNAAWEMRDIACYLCTTDSTLTVSWLATPGADEYEFRLKHFERNVYVDIGSTTDTQYVFTLPRSGHWIVELRGINTTNEGPWSVTTDPQYGVVNGQARGWWLYGYLAPVGPITIGWIKNNMEGEIEYGSQG